MKINWLWDTRLPDTRVKKILKNDKDPRFYIYAEKLFSRLNNPREAFNYVSKKTFRKTWPVIKQRVEKDAWAKKRVEFWQNIYEKETGQKDVFEERMSIAAQIKIFRVQMGYTQKEMAKKLGVIQQYISKLEAGRENLTIDTLKHVANILEKKLVIQLA